MLYLFSCHEYQEGYINEGTNLDKVLQKCNIFACPVSDFFQMAFSTFRVVNFTNLNLY